jgi:DNA ligase-1
MKLPKLYKKTSTGADQEWEISTEGSTIVTRWGQCGGTIQEGRDDIATGKNLGKKNETTREQQADLEAQSQWEKKLKKGYVQTLDDAREGKTDAIITGGVAPMLAHRFDEQGHKIVYPCYVQPKLDGHRCIAVVDADGKCTLWTRTRKPITSMVHIQRAIEALCFKVPMVLDGELYNHDYRDKFEQLTSFIRDTKVKPGAEVVQYHIYDRVSDGPFEARMLSLLNGPADDFGPCLKLVETTEAEDEDELMLAFDAFLKLGYEGAMARNAEGPYVNKRSYDLLKIKEFLDSEFEVVGVEEGRGKLAGHAIFVCRAESGAEFRAKMKGETAALKQYWDNPALAIGRQLTVKYQGLTTKNGVPRFPVALRFKED